MYSYLTEDLTDEEARAIRSLERLAKKWPQSLQLFGAAGSLLVRRLPEGGNGGGNRFTVATILGIPADGGDGGDDY
jgi:hypothetical protein